MLLALSLFGARRRSLYESILPYPSQALARSPVVSPRQWKPSSFPEPSLAWAEAGAFLIHSTTIPIHSPLPKRHDRSANHPPLSSSQKFTSSKSPASPSQTSSHCKRHLLSTSSIRSHCFRKHRGLYQGMTNMYVTPFEVPLQSSIPSFQLIRPRSRLGRSPRRMDTRYLGLVGVLTITILFASFTFNPGVQPSSCR